MAYSKTSTRATSNDARRRGSAQPIVRPQVAAAGPVAGVAPPRRSAATTPSSSRLGHGARAPATRLARGYERYSKRPRSGAKLSAVRHAIDRLDGRLLRLLNERALLAQAIGRIKHRKKWPVFDARREASVLRHVSRKNRGPLSEHAVRHVFQAILCECRRRERSSTKKHR